MSEIKVDTVAEKTSANGVTVDGLNIKDSKLVTANSVITSNITDANITTAKIADVNVTEGKIADNAITLAKMASGTDGNIISYDASGNPVAIATGNDGQVLTSTGAGSPPAFETLPAGGITMAAQWRVNSDATGNHSPINSNWEAADTDGNGNIGSNMTESSGIFTFPSTGIYYIELQVSVSTNATLYNNITIQTTLDNSGFNSASEGYVFLEQNSQYSSSTVSFIFDVTNTSTHKVRFVSSPQDTSAKMMGDTHNHRTGATFIRLGDT